MCFVRPVASYLRPKPQAKKSPIHRTLLRFAFSARLWLRMLSSILSGFRGYGLGFNWANFSYHHHHQRHHHHLVIIELLLLLQLSLFCFLQPFYSLSVFLFSGRH